MLHPKPTPAIELFSKSKADLDLYVNYLSRSFGFLLAMKLQSIMPGVMIDYFFAEPGKQLSKTASPEMRISRERAEIDELCVTSILQDKLASLPELIEYNDTISPLIISLDIINNEIRISVHVFKVIGDSK